MQVSWRIKECSSNVATMLRFVKAKAGAEGMSPRRPDALPGRENNLLLPRMKLAVHRPQIIDGDARIELCRLERRVAEH